MSGLIIRQAGAPDTGALALLARAFRDHLGRTAPTDAQFREGIAGLLASPEATFLLAERDGEPLGYVLLRRRRSMWAAGLEATLEDLFVDPARRGGGTGRALVEAALDHARQTGCVTICLDTNERNEASNRIYGALGFSGHSARWNGRQVFLRRAL